jgi:hypothetical protein
MKSKVAIRQQLHSVLQIHITPARLVVIAVVLLLGASLSFVIRAQSIPIKQIAPDALVANLYRQAPDRVFQARSRALVDKYFEKSLADLIWMELLHWESSGASEMEPFDYVLYNFGHGEGTITKPLIGKPSYEGRKAQVNVSYNVVYARPAVSKRSVHKETIAFLLAAGETGWKITDIRYDCGFDWCVDGGKLSLFEMYSMDSKATAAEREYWEQTRGSAQGYKDYLQKYPNGAYASVARAKIK